MQFGSVRFETVKPNRCLLLDPLTYMVKRDRDRERFRERERERDPNTMASHEALRSSLHQAIQGTQASLHSWGMKLQNLIHPKPNPVRTEPCTIASEVTLDEQPSSRNFLEAWHRNSSWTDDPPLLNVKSPKGTLCELRGNFRIGLPPDDVFDILVDPGNKRVFKNIKEVTYRKVLEDHGHRQLVEVEHTAIWRFLCFSGTLLVRVIVDQNRQTHKVNFSLSKEGFMKRFEGTWDIKPIYVDAPHCSSMASPETDPVCISSRVASEVTLLQVVQPKIIPPPPISWYVRGISSKQTEILLQDLQIEAKRLREGNIEVNT